MDCRINSDRLGSGSVGWISLRSSTLPFVNSARLKYFVEKNATVEQIDLYQVMRAAGQVESLLGLTANTRFESPKRNNR